MQEEKRPRRSKNDSLDLHTRTQGRSPLLDGKGIHTRTQTPTESLLLVIVSLMGALVLRSVINYKQRTTVRKS